MDTIKHTFAVRGYELDADGLVPAHIWLRYMEHLRWVSATRGPAELVENFRAGHTFMVVSQSLHLNRDIGLGTELAGSMWIGRVGRTSIDFLHAFQVDRSPVAIGRVTAVWIEDGRPAPLPEALREVEAAPPVAEPSFPEPMRDAAPGDAFLHTLHVRPADLDLLRHVNHSSYSVFVDAARHAAAAAGGYGDASEPAASRLTAITIEYLAQSLLGERLSQATWVDGSDPLTLGFELTRDGTVLSRARVLTRNLS